MLSAWTPKTQTRCKNTAHVCVSQVTFEHISTSPDRKRQNHQTFAEVCRRPLDTGTLAHIAADRGRPAREWPGAYWWGPIYQHEPICGKVLCWSRGRLEGTPWTATYPYHLQYVNVKVNEMGWACGAYGRGEGVYRVLLGKPEGRRPLGRRRRRWVDNIRMDLQEVGCVCMDWIGLAQDRDRWRTLVSAVMNLRVPWNAGNFLTSCRPVSFSRRTLYRGVSICMLLVPHMDIVIQAGFILCQGYIPEKVSQIKIVHIEHKIPI